jgi:hypothetical protein
MKVMLDTNICIYLIKQQPSTVIERFLSQPVGDQYFKYRGSRVGLRGQQEPSCVQESPRA